LDALLCIKELKSERNVDELLMEMHMATNTIVADFNGEIQAFRASQGAKMANFKLTNPRMQLARRRLRVTRQGLMPLKAN